MVLHISVQLAPNVGHARKLQGPLKNLTPEVEEIGKEKKDLRRSKVGG